jgi:hypothetical protein
MVGNVMPDNSGNIYVEFDYNNIILVDPNKTIDNFGNIKDRLIDHENMVMYVNLEADVLPRTKLAVGGTSQDRIQTISVAKMNFLKPNDGKSLTTGYYDEFTGKGSLEGNGQNQKKEIATVDYGNKPYIRETVVDESNIVDNGLLGITSIYVTTNSSFIPSVKIEMEDVQGKALFQLGNNSPYSAFFNLPYPQFYLTLKGYVGQAIRYQLNLEKFSARFNSFSGNYQISLEFKGYKFNILNEISMGHLLATPHMYGQTFTVNSSPSQLEPSQSNTVPNSVVDANNQNNSSVSTETIATKINSERGYEKIREVYSEYKSKGLISKDFPEITLVQLMFKLEKFEDLIADKYPKANMEPLTNIRIYKKILKEYYNKLRGNSNSWFTKNINTRQLVLEGGTIVNIFKKSVLQNLDAQNKAIESLKNIITDFNKQLSENPTLGDKSSNRIKNNITYSIVEYSLNGAVIDWKKTTQLQTGIPNPDETDIEITKKQYKGLFRVQASENDGELVLKNNPNFFIFEGQGRFDSEIFNIETQANKKLTEYEISISSDLAKKFEDSTFGIGFKPTVRNIVAVIMASTEAFIRLMDEVHKKAWDVKYDPVRQRAVQSNSSSAPSSDTVDNVQFRNQIDNTTPGSKQKNPVYPWPQFFTETNDDKKGRFQLTYPGDPSVIDLTQAYLYDKWPEVEFVEEYLKGLSLKFNNPNYPDPLVNDKDTNIINVNAIEYPQDGITYLNKDEIKFFYEIWERQFLTSHYTGFSRVKIDKWNNLINLNSSVEVQNILSSLGISSPYLALKLKNYKFTAQNYIEDALKNFSNQGTGKSYQEFIRDVFVTPYLKRATEDTFDIISTQQLGKDPQLSPSLDELESIIKQSPNDPLVIDTLPFTNAKWVNENMSLSNLSSGNQVYNTNKTIKIYGFRNIISNFTDVYNFTENRPVTNFSFYGLKDIPYLNTDLNTFYLSRTPKNFISTEGYYSSISPTTSQISKKTTSILNTPYFVNAILNGVYNNRRSDKYPYVQAAYLFLNSLPLATLRERYKSLTNDVESELDYISSVFKKFGAIHKMPYAWVLKYGSIWHRYKKYIEDNVDILDSAWNDFDYINNYSPIQKSAEQVYKVNGNNIILQTQTEGVINLQVGFYPKVINDFYYFYNGYDLYQDYTDEEIQKSVNNGVKLFNFSNSNINSIYQSSKIFEEKTWSVVVPKLNILEPEIECEVPDNTKLGGYFIVPSFGTSLNETYDECFSPNRLEPVSESLLVNNKSIYNGSIRTLWSVSNYGYFNTDSISKPTTDSYVNQIKPNGNQSPFELLTDSNSYSKIEEIFSVFEKSILDQFEIEFLNFCKSESDSGAENQITTYSQSNVDINSMFRNFQTLFTSLMSIESKSQSQNDSNYFNSIINDQLINFQTTIKSFLEYDVILKYGNPSFYRRRIFDSYLSHNSVTQYVESPIKFNPYVVGSLPSINGSTNLQQSQLQYPKEWKRLQNEVGFSTIPNVNYSNSGSTITDFFIDNNIEFTEDNITILSPLIKMYATQKLNNSKLTSDNFKQLVIDYLNNATQIQNLMLNDILDKIRAGLPDQQQLPEKTIQSVFDGQQGKVETYELFKALNDKWIAGYDLEQKSLFEDFLFLDRASRDIGDTVLIDIYDLKNMFNEKSLNQIMSVYTFISGILINNNFTVMNLPAYVNFYNTQNVDGVALPRSEGSLEFANNMWGTFLNVDYRKSSPKIVCVFVGKPSEYLDLPKGNFRFRDDGFDVRKSSENPLLENLEGKTDWDRSNKCVGFNVDIGVKNQNLFYSFSVAQDPGIATSEAIQTYLNMVDQASGRNTSTQNNSILNLYKSRSYQCTIECLGNALIQPTMYFNLRYVPMFYGPYLVTQVEHSIQPGSFTTKFNGIRQGLFDLPLMDKFIQSVNKNLLSRVEEIVKNRKDSSSNSSTSDKQKSQNVVGDSDMSKAEENSCSAKLNPYYAELRYDESYVNVPLTQTNLTDTEFANILKSEMPENPLARTIIYLISYLRSYQKATNGSAGSFRSFNNNFATVELTDKLNPSDQFFQKTYSCLNVNSAGSVPIANFESPTKFVQFMRSRINNSVIERILELGLTKFYVCFWPTDNIKESNYDQNQFSKITKTFYDGVSSAIKSGLVTEQQVRNFSIVSGEKKQTQTETENNTNESTGSPTVSSCDLPSVTSFYPKSGVANTILQINGEYFLSVTGITFGNVNIDKSKFIVFNDNTIRISVPLLNPNDDTNILFTLKSSFGDYTSTQPFQYKSVGVVTSSSAGPTN